MRRSIVVVVLAIACAIAAFFYVEPGASQKALELAGLRSAASGKTDSAKSGDHAVAVVTATAITADFPIRRYALGFIASPAVVNVNARISSQIVSVAVKDGQMVKAGDLLFKLDSRTLQAQAEHDEAMLAKDQATLVSNSADLQRAKDLMAKQAGTQQAYDQALAVQQAAIATVDADKAQLDGDKVQLGFATITAPITGRLGAVNVSIGDLVGPSGSNGSNATPLVTITQMDPLEVQFTLPERDFELLRSALAKPKEGAVTLRRDGSSKPIGSGTLDFVDSSVDTASGTIAARASIPNPGLALWPGQYVNVVLQAGTMPAMTSIPTVAIQPSQKGPFVYVVGPDDRVEARPVEVALSAGANSAIGKGLKAGERVVVEGQTRLRDGALVHQAKAAPGDSGKVADAAAPADGTRR
jgi:multidrug efflux system membrane fusion protein